MIKLVYSRKVDKWPIAPLGMSAYFSRDDYDKAREGLDFTDMNRRSVWGIWDAFDEIYGDHPVWRTR